MNAGRLQCTDHLNYTRADVNVNSDDGKRAIVKAANRGRYACLSLLVKAGADVSILDKNDGTVLTKAA